MGEAQQRVHDRKLSRMIELQPRSALAVGKDGGLSQLPQFTAIQKCFQDVPLHVLVSVGDALHFLSQCVEVLDSLVDVVTLADIVRRGFKAEHIMIPHRVFGEAVLVIAPHHRVPQMQVLNLGLQFVRVLLGDPSAEDHGKLVRSADVAVGIQQPFSHFL